MGTPADLSGWGQKSLYDSKAVPPPGGANDGGGIGRGWEIISGMVAAIEVLPAADGASYQRHVGTDG